MASKDVRPFSLTEKVNSIIQSKNLYFGKFMWKYISKLEEIAVDVLKRWRSWLEMEQNKGLAKSSENIHFR